MKTEHLGKIQYLLLLDIENILVMLKTKQKKQTKKKKGAVFILCESCSLCQDVRVGAIYPDQW